jgi:hypothetical protein
MLSPYTSREVFGDFLANCSIRDEQECFPKMGSARADTVPSARLAHRVSKPGVGGRVWDEAWNRVVQSARHHVKRADVQDYSKTPYTVVNRLFLALVNHNPFSPDHSALASMTIESCAIMFIQQAKTCGPYSLYSRIGAWMTPEWWSVIEWEEATERRSQQQRHTVDHKER